MRKTAFLTLGALLLISGSMSAQENDEVRYNQYGVAVDRKELHTEARNNILVMESKDQSYKLWMDNRVQVDGASAAGSVLHRAAAAVARTDRAFDDFYALHQERIHEKTRSAPDREHPVDRGFGSSHAAHGEKPRLTDKERRSGYYVIVARFHFAVHSFHL